jgi:TolB protein
MPLITRRSVLKLGLASGALAFAASPAEALVQIVVSGANFVPLPIAIPDFASADPSFGREIADIVRADLSRSGLFAPADPATLPAAVGDVGSEPDFAAWRATNVDALVMGQVQQGGTVDASVRLWDTQAAQQMVGKSYSTGADNYRRIAHIVADSIYEALTSGGGYFDTRVLYVAESGPKANRSKKLAIMDQDGANIQYLSSGKALTLGPRLSPDGQSVTFTSYEDGNPQVYVAALGGTAKKLVNNAPMSFAPRYTPDGQSIIFSVSNGDATNLYQAGIGGARPVQLTDGAAIDTSPCYSPDGSRIVFESDRGGTQQIYMMAASGGAAQRISFGNGRYSTPVWSPVGDLVAFTRQADDGFQIGTMKPDGSGERILSSSGQVQESPSWSPNGRVLMFDRDPGGDGGPSLYSVDIWGRNEIKIPTETYASDPSWSPLRS